MNVYIMGDMEGISLVTEWDQVKQGHPFYAKYQSLYTEEIGAAVEGALAAGAKRIVINDGHGSADYNLLWEKLPDMVEIERPDTAANIFPSMELSPFDALLLIGYHAMEGTPGAVLAHTQSHENWHSYSVNGQTYGEIGQLALIAGHYGVPVVFISGDRAAVEEARSLLGEDLPGVTVKNGHAHGKATCLHPAVSKRLIRESVEQALRSASVKTREPLALGQPHYNVEVTFKKEAAAESFEGKPGVTRIGDMTIAKRVGDSSRILDL
ncbi:M55 family metallopeptidase [Paenibacillus sp. MBLB4367]|uniref:M55 family metallopeptidase n=1 Tax=Paenibacillus sp. MBLB4367 TaxID=3384767 RepID=UPI003907ED33